MKLLSDADRRRIEAAIGALEKRTAAEVVVAVVGRSVPTLLGRFLCGAAVALVAGLVFLELWPALDARLSVVVELAAGCATFALFGVRALERLLVMRHAAKRAVMD
ncbi:MAG TPA: hypothetical protein VGQ57_18150, partial [Polyangiaceae bacterium]|nr:hypothetical protein [Polyangiaceae bacterium]